MPIRNPFARKPGPVPANDEYLNPSNAPASQPAGFERVDTKGSKASSALSLGSTRSQDTGEYKMSVVNDSGVYLPPSPTEEKGQWPRQYISRKSTETRSSIGDIEPFSISRESFDSYRRSFDVSARTPVTTTTDMPTRQSLDSARFSRPPRSAINGARKMEVQPPTAEENFEDVGLDDKPARKHGFFSKFSNAQTPDRESSPQPTMSRFLPGRKRGQSGQGAELGAMDHPKVMVTTHDN